MPLGGHELDIESDSIRKESTEIEAVFADEANLQDASILVL